MDIHEHGAGVDGQLTSSKNYPLDSVQHYEQNRRDR